MRGPEGKSMPTSRWAWQPRFWCDVGVGSAERLRPAGAAGEAVGGTCRDCQRGWFAAGHDAADQYAGDEVDDEEWVLHDVGADDGGVDHAAKSCEHVDGCGA